MKSSLGFYTFACVTIPTIVQVIGFITYGQFCVGVGVVAVEVRRFEIEKEVCAEVIVFITTLEQVLLEKVNGIRSCGGDSRR